MVANSFYKNGFLLICLATAATAEARPPYMDAFETLYGIKEQKPATQEKQDLRTRVAAVRCNVCHATGRPKTERNSYGQTLEALLPTYNEAAYRDARTATDAYQQVYAGLQAAEQEASPARYRFGDLIKNGYLPTYGGK